MKKTTLWLFAILWLWALLLTGCKSDKTETPVAEPETPEVTTSAAAEYCVAQWWIHEIVTSETAVYGECTLPDGTKCEEWDYYEGRCPGNTEEMRTSLTAEELEYAEENNFPKSYTYSIFDIENGTPVDAWEFVYPEDFSHTLLIPEHATMASRDVISSGIQDGMIYTITNVTLQDGTQLSVLYINNPKTLNFVAASVENGNISTNYQFSY